MVIVQIVPHLPPPFEGLGGNALVLAGALAERFGIETAFLVGDPAWAGEAGRSARALPRRHAAELAGELGKAKTVLLHYANYAYQRRGCPVWLVKALLRWRTGAAERRLVTSFHEVCASGPLWRSSFWLRPIQRRLAAAVARCSDAMVTSLPLYEEILRPWARRKEIALMPVLSTVGEPASPPFLAGRSAAVVVFGGAGVRQRAYTSFQPALARTVQALTANEVWDIGPAVDTPVAVGGVRVRNLGVLPPSEVSLRLADAVAGFVAYPPSFLAKSGIFAAYCAHGLLPVCAWDGEHQERNPPAAGQHYWSAGDEGLGDPQAIASAARDWYAGHSSEHQAGTLRKLLLSGAST